MRETWLETVSPPTPRPTLDSLKTWSDSLCSCNIQEGGVSYLITDMNGEDDGEDASRWIPPMTLKPVVKDVLDEGWVVNQDLQGERTG